MNIYFFISFTIFALTDIIPLFKEKKKNDIVAFLILSIFVYFIAFLYFQDELRNSFIYNFFKFFNVDM
jgi:hypothetical protein